MSSLDTHKIAAARLWAAHRYPYLASALFAAPVVAVDGLGTVAADARWRMYADPDVVTRWSVAELGAELVHHAGHLLRDHAERGRDLGFAEDELSHWLDAADAEINDDLPADLVLPGQPVLPHDLGCETGRFAEEYFRLGEARDQRAPSDDCGSAAHGHARPYELDDGADRPAGMDDAEQDLLRRRVAAEIASQDPGTVPEGLRRWAEALVDPRVDWRTVLAAELRRGLADVSGSVDYSYRRPSRRAAVQRDVVLPSLRRPTPEIAVVVDTSGSMDGDILATAMSELDGLLRAVGVRTNGVRTLVCDAAVHGIERIRSASQLALQGGGGTDMGEGIRVATELRPRPQLIVVITDGHTPWPAEAPVGVRVIVVLLGRYHGHAPAWARTVAVDEVA